MSSFYGNHGGSGGGGGEGTFNYNELLNIPIKNIDGTEENPIVLQDLSYGAYNINGRYSFTENDTIRRYFTNQNVYIYKDYVTQGKHAKYEVFDNNTLYFIGVSFIEDEYIYNVDSFNLMAPIEDPNFKGSVTLSKDPSSNLEAVTKQYVDRLINGLVSSAPGIVSLEKGLPASNYRAGETWRVTENGVYAGQKCETGDLIICVNNFSSSFSNDDFIVVQANIDGAVTGSETSVDANIVIYDGITGKKITDSSINISQIVEVINKMHTHGNLSVLNTYTQTQDDIIGEAVSQANGYTNDVTFDLVNQEYFALFSTSVVVSKTQPYNQINEGDIWLVLEDDE